MTCKFAVDDQLVSISTSITSLQTFPLSNLRLSVSRDKSSLISMLSDLTILHAPEASFQIDQLNAQRVYFLKVNSLRLPVGFNCQLTNLAYFSVTQLAGAQSLTLCAPNLVVLSIQYAYQLEYADLRLCPALERLRLCNSVIERLDVSANASLREIDLASNRLSSIYGIAACTSLASLELSGNRLSEVPWTAPLGVKFLDLARNYLTIADFARETALYAVFLAENPLCYQPRLPEHLAAMNSLYRHLRPYPAAFGALQRLQQVSEEERLDIQLYYQALMELKARLAQRCV